MVCLLERQEIALHAILNTYPSMDFRHAIQPAQSESEYPITSGNEDEAN